MVNSPCARYLPGISAAQPGLRVGFERANMAARFPDAVAPYCHFGCDVRQRFPGTFFRFPLRYVCSGTNVLCKTCSVVHLYQPSAHLQSMHRSEFVQHCSWHRTVKPK